MISVSYFYHATIGLCYFVAFRSLYNQYPGLFGYNGLVPGDIFLSKIVDQLTFGSSLYGIFQSNIQLDCLLDYLFIIGTSASIFIVTGFHSSLLFLITFICYLLIYTIGQEVFLSFQWDILLLEIGFLSIFTSPYLLYPYYEKSLTYKIKVNWLYAIRFLSFKLMFLSGVVKIQSGCPTWLKLTALEYHYATQPLPTSYAWLASQLPPIIHRFFVAMTLVIEIPLAILLTCPIGFVRKFTGSLQVLLQLGIMITGNYNFFNILTIALMMPSFANDVDENNNSNNDVTNIPIKERIRRMFDQFFLIFAKASFCVLLLYLSFNWMIDFNYAKYIDNVNHNYWWKGDIINIKYNFWSNILNPILPAIYKSVLLISILATVVYISCDIYVKFRQSKYRYDIMLWIKSFLVIISTVFSVVWILLAAVPIDRPIMTSIIPEKIISLSSTLSSNYHCFASYGLFRRMTGVGSIYDHNMYNFDLSYVARPEIILEGYDNTTETWREIPFLYKPSLLNSLPVYVIPDQPRLDWQMWFAALSPYQYNHWFLYLAFILLKSSSNEEVLKLLDYQNYPFKTSPPQLIRASLYDYDFSHINETWFTKIPHSEIVPLTSNDLFDIFVPFQKYSSKDGKSKWWRRGNQREYIATISLDNVKSVVPYKDRYSFIYFIVIIIIIIINFVILFQTSGNINRFKICIKCVGLSIKVSL